MTSRPISLQLGVPLLHLIARHHSIVILIKKTKLKKIMQNVNTIQTFM
jgi:hypothetical protein